jgi:hypothetical protein
MFRQSGGREMVRVSLLLLVFLVALGCTHAIPMKGTMEAPPPTTAKVPLRLGVYYSPDFRNYRYVGSRGGDRWDFPLGSSSTRLFDRVFADMFISAQSMGSRPPLSGSKGKLDAVLEPNIESFDFTIPYLKTGAYTAEITYRFTLYAMNGEPLASWTVRGFASKHGKPSFDFARWPGEAADLAMQDAASKFITGFPDIPEVRRLINQARASTPK